MQVRTKNNTSWGIFLLLASVFYLIPEAIFNSQIIKMIGSGTISYDEIEKLEIFGRAISAIGVTIFLANFIPKKFTSKLHIASLSLAVLTAIVWPIVFYGQKFLIDELIINKSSSLQRQQAYLATIIQTAIAEDSMRIEQLNHRKDKVGSSESLTFITMLGGILYLEKELLIELENKKVTIIKSHIERKTEKEIDELYKKYEDLYDFISEKYENYRNGSDSYNASISKGRKKIEKIEEDIDITFNEGWEKYKIFKSKYNDRLLILSEKLALNMDNYFKKEKYCKTYTSKLSRNMCLEANQERYDKHIHKLGIGHVKPNYWLLSDFYYTNEPAHYLQKLKGHKEIKNMFYSKTGYSYDISSYKEFKDTYEIAKKIRNKLKIMGIGISENWKPSNSAELENAINKKIREKANEEWYKMQKSKGLILSPNLSWSEFKSHKEIKKLIKGKMGDMYYEEFTLDLNLEEFRKEIITRYIKRKVIEYIKILNAQKKEFEDQGKYENEGKKALRSIVIPPIASGISLFLICVTILMLPYRLHKILSGNPKNIDKRRKWFKLDVIVLPILFVPLFLVSNKYTDNESINKIISEVKAGPVAEYYIKWILHAQPIIQPIGEYMEKKTNLYENFEGIKVKLEEID